MSDYGQYIFELGESNKRTYTGERMRPLTGFEFGLEVSKIIADLLTSVESGEDVKGLLGSGSGGYESKHALSLLAKCITKIDSKEYMTFMRRATTSNLLVKARVEGDSRTHLLDSESNINAWFEKYPGDLAKFSARIIWENASPFLPEEFQKLLASTKET